MSTIPFKLVCIDLDGTLLQPDHTVSELTKKVLQKLTSLGVYIVIATGRPYTDVRHVKKTLQLEKITDTTGHCGICYTITSNGARVYDTDDNLMMRKNIPEKLCRLLYALAKDDHEININIFRDIPRKQVGSPLYCTEFADPKTVSLSQISHNNGNGMTSVDDPANDNDSHEEWVCRRPADEEAKLYERSRFCFRVEENLEVNYPTDNVSEIFFLCYNASKAAELEEAILKLSNDYEHHHSEKIDDKGDCEPTGVMVLPSAVHCLDVVPKSTSKGVALQDVAVRLGVTMDDVIAFGDGMNDVSMLSIVKKGCIMDNASSRVKKTLPDLEIIGSNSEDGVAKKLQEVFGISKECIQ